MTYRGLPCLARSLRSLATAEGVLALGSFGRGLLATSSPLRLRSCGEALCGVANAFGGLPKADFWVFCEKVF